MALFGFGKKKEKEINAPVCTCNGNCSVSETVEPENLNNCCQDIQGRICCIKVLGSGCASCHALYENTQSAVKAMGISVEVEYITDLKKVMEYGVMSVPALVVNNKVVSTGKVLKTENVQKLLQKIVSESNVSFKVSVNGCCTTKPATPMRKSGVAEQRKCRFPTLPCMRNDSFIRLISIFKTKKPSRAISRQERKSRRSCCLKQSALCRKKKGKLSCCTISRA